MINAEKYWWIMRVNIDDQCKIILMINVEKYWISMQMNIDGQYREIKDEFERNALNMPWAWVKICTTLRSSLASVPKQALYKIGKSSLSIWNGVSSPLFLHCASQAPLGTCKCRFHQVGSGSTSSALSIQEFSWSKIHSYFKSTFLNCIHLKMTNLWAYYMSSDMLLPDARKKSYQIRAKLFFTSQKKQDDCDLIMLTKRRACPAASAVVSPLTWWGDSTTKGTNKDRIFQRS